MAFALGIDVGNAKVKLCLADLDDRSVRWTSRPLPYDARRPRARHRDFEEGLPVAISEFVAGREVPVATCVMTSGYAYPSYREGAIHTMDVLTRSLPGTRLLALAIDGGLVASADAESAAHRIAFTNGAGAAHLAARLPSLGQPPSGLVIDTGGDTSQVNALVDGAFDPATMADPRGALDHRLRHGKFVWVGAQTTPLESLVAAIEIADRRYPVIPRGVRFDNVSALLELLPADEAARLSLFKLHPDRDRALAAIAESINLDREMASEEELMAVATRYFDAAVARLAGELERALATLPSHARGRALLFGLGTALTRAACLRAGVPSDGIFFGCDFMDPQHAIIASVYGACHAAAEVALQRRLPVSLRE